MLASKQSSKFGLVFKDSDTILEMLTVTFFFMLASKQSSKFGLVLKDSDTILEMLTVVLTVC